MPRSKSSTSSSQSFWDHPIATIEEALSLRKQIDKLQTQLSKTLGSATSSVAEVVMGKSTGRKKMSPAARAKIAAAQRARWAKSKGSSAKAPAAAKATPTSTGKKKGKLTPEGRARLAAAMKARWAARKKGAPAPNASK